MCFHDNQSILPHRVERPFYTCGKTMEYWRKNCQNPVFYQLALTIERSKYSNFFSICDIAWNNQIVPMFLMWENDCTIIFRQLRKLGKSDYSTIYHSWEKYGVF
jgi:hypothetical protein